MPDKDQIILDIELSDDAKQGIREFIHTAMEEAASEFSLGFEARIRKIVFDAMRERDLRVAQK